MAEPLAPYAMADLGAAAKRRAPAAARNVGPIGDVLAEWLPASGIVLEIASGTGEHALAFARRFPALTWQPSDQDPLALSSIAAWRGDRGPDNLLAPIALDAAGADWPAGPVDAIVSINMVHIAPWAAAEGLAANAGRLLAPGGRLILYGPWWQEGAERAPSNLDFDAQLKARDPRFGLREVGEFARLAAGHGLDLDETRAMPANNLMLRFSKG